MDENTSLQAAELRPQPGKFNNVNSWWGVVDIRPQEDVYPSYDKNMKVEDYYVYNDFRYSQIRRNSDFQHIFIRVTIIVFILSSILMLI